MKTLLPSGLDVLIGWLFCTKTPCIMGNVLFQNESLPCPSPPPASWPSTGTMSGYAASSTAFIVGKTNTSFTGNP